MLTYEIYISRRFRPRAASRARSLIENLFISFHDLKKILVHKIRAVAALTSATNVLSALICIVLSAPFHYIVIFNDTTFLKKCFFSINISSRSDIVCFIYAWNTNSFCAKTSYQYRTAKTVIVKSRRISPRYPLRSSLSTLNLALPPAWRRLVTAYEIAEDLFLLIKDNCMGSVRESFSPCCRMFRRVFCCKSCRANVNAESFLVMYYVVWPLGAAS